MIRFLSESAVIWMHDYLIRSYGGTAGIHSTALLDSALHQPLMERYYLNASLLEMAAAYAFHICKNHAFIDGNKRTARMAMIMFLRYNNVKITATEYEIMEKILDVAANKISKKQLADWLQTVIAIEQG